MTKDEIKLQVQQKIRDAIAGNQVKQKTIGGFFQNLKSDITGMGKGILGLGREAVTHPIQSGKAVWNTVDELGNQMIDSTPSFLQQMTLSTLHPIQRARELKSEVEKLRAIPYEQQRKMLDEMGAEAIKKNKGQGVGKEALSLLGSGLLSDTMQEITHPAEFAYNKPFTFGLDVLAMGGGKVIGKGVEGVSKTKIGTELEKLFVPAGKLKAEGYGAFADDLLATQEAVSKSQRTIITDTAKKFEKDFGLNGTEREQFFNTIDELRRAEKGIKATSPNPKIQTAIDWWLNDEVPKLQKAAGLPDEKAITNYLHHFFPEKMSGAEARVGSQFASKGYLKASEDVTGFSTDPIVSISAIKSKVAADAIRDSFIQRTIDKYGEEMGSLKARLGAKIGLDEVGRLEKEGKLVDTIKREFGLEEFKPQGSIRFFPVTTEAGNKVAGVTKKVETHLMPKPIVDSLNSLYSPKTQNLLFNVLDTFNRNWKPLATAVRPRYHTRNIIGNLYNSIVVGGMDIKNIPQAAYQQIGNYFNELRKSNTVAGTLSRKLLPEFTDPKYLKMAIEDDVVGRGFFAMDLHDLAKAAMSGDDIIKAINQVKNPAEIYRIPILRQWLNASHNIGQAIEDNARLGMYIHGLKEGMTRIEAKAYVNKHLFDYLSGLGDADKVIKKFIPFWSWTRFNLPLQLESVAMTPLRHVVLKKTTSPYVQSVEQNDPLQSYLTQQEKDAGMFRVGTEKVGGQEMGKYARTASVLPQNDLVKIMNIFDLEQLGVNPVVSLLQRLNDNRDFFGQMIERFGGEKKKFLGMALRGKVIEGLKIVPFLSELNKFIGGSDTTGEKQGIGLRLEQVLSPLSVTLKNDAETKAYGMLDKEKELKGSWEAGLEGLYKRYLVKSEVSPDEKVFRDNVLTLEKILKEKGITDLQLLPIKLKAAGEAIKQQIGNKIKKQIK